MKVTTKQYLIANIADSWKKQYYNRINDTIYKRLLSEKPTTTKQVEDIIGNSSWTTNRCHECGQDSNAIVEIGQEPDYDSSTAQICESCLRKAIRLIEGEK